MDIYKKLGAVVKQAREEKGWTQQELAEHLKQSPEYVFALEDGKGNPEYTVLAEMIFLLDINPSVILSEMNEKDSVKLDHLYRILLNLPQGQYESLIHSADHQRRWKRNNPDVKTVEDYWETLIAITSDSKVTQEESEND